MLFMKQLPSSGDSLVAQTVEHLPAMQEIWIRSLGQEDPLEKEMAAHSSTLAWKIPWTRRLVGYSPWDRIESDTTEQLDFHFLCRLLRGEMRELVELGFKCTKVNGLRL